jgi:arabinofuranosyltransferase
MTLPDQKYYQPRWLISSLLFLYAIVVLITAWLSDDAYITFRCVDNFLNGYGLTWNITERVQAYTHPLWMFILSFAVFLRAEFYFTSLAVSILFSLAAYYLILKRISASMLNSIAAALILIFSKAYVDYSTSGLENPLTHLLLVLFVKVYFDDLTADKKIFRLSFIAALTGLNRLDILLIIIPALGFEFYKSAEKKKNLIFLLCGFLPLLLWELFSLFYYGFLFPNTAYAKLNIGIDRADLIQQGFFYLQDALYMDPLTFFSILLGMLLPFLIKRKQLIVFTVGVLLYITYTISIGGDFMSGRFFSAPLLVSVMILAKVEINSVKRTLVYAAIVIGLGLLSPRPNIFSTPQYSLGPKIIKAFRFGPTILGMHNGITDERFWYYENTGLLNNLFERKLEKHPWVKHALTFKKSSDELVVKSSLGLFGFYIGRNVHVVDQYALTEPLLARLPSTEYWLMGHDKPKGEKFWRIGHFPRKIPEGYLETIKTGENKIVNPDLAKYYDKVSILIKGNLWNWNRITEIWNFNTGKYDYLLAEYTKTLQPISE